jgi:hypothetical protein
MEDAVSGVVERRRGHEQIVQLVTRVSLAVVHVGDVLPASRAVVPVDQVDVGEVDRPVQRDVAQDRTLRRRAHPAGGG